MKRTLKIAARYADIWNSWSTPDVLAAKLRVLHGHCEAIGRNPRAIDVSTQALLFLSTDEAWLSTKRNIAPGRSIVGTPSEVTDIVQRYREEFERYLGEDMPGGVTAGAAWERSQAAQTPPPV